MSMYCNGNNNQQSKENNKKAKDVLERDWRDRIHDGSFIIYTYANPDGEKATGAAAVHTILQTNVLNRYRYVQDFTKGLTETQLKLTTAKPVARYGMGGMEIKGLIAGCEKSVLGKFWNKSEYWKDAALAGEPILTSIIELSHSDMRYDKLYDERKKLVRDFPESDIAMFIKANEIDPEESIYRLTDNTLIEQKAIIQWTCEYGVQSVIKKVYPALGDYLSRYTFDCPVLAEELTEYFDEYKKQKIQNTISPDFMNLVMEYASNHKYARLQTRNTAVNAIQDKANAYLYWIDALGVEYLSYIAALAKRKGLSIHIEIARADLPTITSKNKHFYETWTGGKKYKEERLDDIKHDDKGGYFFTECEYPIHLASELRVISDAIETAATELAMHNCKSFVVASDHGASRLAVIKKQEEKYETDTKGEHSGRCCKAFEGCTLEHYIEEDGYIVLSDYGRFKGSRAANVEVHGGATLEEVVVPIITLTLKKQTGITIKVMKPDSILVDRHSGVLLNVYISDVESTNNVSVVLNGKRYAGKASDETHYSFELSDIKRAKKYSADVYDGSDLIGKIDFTAKGKTGSVNSDFDELF